MTLQNEEIWQGESQAITVTVKTSAGVTVDITDATMSWQLWHILTGAALTKTTDEGITIAADQTTYKGQCTITISEDDTADLMPLTYWHGLYYTPETGDSDVVMEGYVTVKPSRGLPPEEA